MNFLNFYFQIVVYYILTNLCYKFHRNYTMSRFINSTHCMPPLQSMESLVHCIRLMYMQPLTIIQGPVSFRSTACHATGTRFFPTRTVRTVHVLQPELKTPMQLPSAQILLQSHFIQVSPEYEPRSTNMPR